MLSLWHWIAAHPEASLTIAFALLSLANRVLKGAPKSWAGIALDRVAALQRRGAAGTLSWPIIGRSLFPDALVPQPPLDPAKGEIVPASPEPKS